MERLVLGYDIGREEAERMIADLHGACADLLACDPALIPGEHRLLAMFADLRTLTLPRHLEDETEPQILQSPEENLNAWLRSFETEAEGLGPDFVTKLRRALAHYGIDSLDRTAGLEEACYRLFLSQQRVQAARAAIIAILDRRFEDADQLAGHVGDDFREALDRLVVAHEGRDPVVADLAREVRFRYFDGRIISEARERVYAEMQQQIARLTSDPDGADRDELIAAIVDCVRPLSTLLTTSMRTTQQPARSVLVEAMARRYYRVRSLEGFERVDAGGNTFVRGRYSFQGQQRHLWAAYVELEDVAGAVAAFISQIESLPEDRAGSARPLCRASRRGADARRAR